jgi:hypothetical protein
MTTRTTTFGQGSHPVRAVDLKTGVRGRSSNERAIWRSSGLRTEDFSHHCSSLLIGVLFTYRYQTTNGIFTRRAKQITQNVGRHCDSEDQSGNVGRDGGHNSMVQNSPRVTFTSTTSICFGLLILVTVDKEMAAVLAILLVVPN